MKNPLQKIKIIADTREQDPYKFSNFPDVEIISQKLDTGDYSLVGFEDIITVERKSLNDFWGSITSGRERFEKEVERMSLFKHKFIVVENKLDKTIEYAKTRTLIHSNMILGTIAGWTLKYSVPFVFLSNRFDCQFFIHSFFKQYLSQTPTGLKEEEKI
jgi:ERCC4-type nuclease